MGHSSYDSNSRSVRSDSLGYHSKPVDEIFAQNKVRRIHESMEPSKALLRECCDSVNHPNTVPIIIALDVTGSMGNIPHHMVKDGLPHMVNSMIENGVKSPSILFLAIGDHQCDNAPLQVGQFESGDEELDNWLTRTWIEGRGGANEGESYLLAWYFAAHHVSMDSFDKRGKKGFIFTIGDEPSLKHLPANVITELMGDGAQKGMSDKELLEAAKKKFHVFNLHITQTGAGRSHETAEYWDGILGQRNIKVDDYKNVPTIIAETVLANTDKSESNDFPPADSVGSDGETTAEVEGPPSGTVNINEDDAEPTDEVKPKYR